MQPQLKESPDSSHFFLLGPIISISQLQNKGIKIDWNLNGLLSLEKFQRYHVFIFYQRNFQLCKQFITDYYKLMKVGEYLGVFYSKINTEENKNQEIGRIEWIQKTGMVENEQIISQLIKQKYLKKRFQVEDVECLISYINGKNMRGFIIVNVLNFVSQNELKNGIHKIVQIFQYVRSKYSKQIDKFVFNFIRRQNYFNVLDCSKGLNFFYCHLQNQEQQKVSSFNFSQEQPNLEQIKMKSNQNPELIQNKKQMIAQILAYISLVVVKKIKLEIKIKNGLHCAPTNGFNWKISSAFCLQKVFYGIPRCQFSQSLIFSYMNRNQISQSQNNLEIMLGLQLFFYDNREIKSKKQFSFAVYSESEQSKWWTTCFHNDNCQYGTTLIGNKRKIYSNLIDQESRIIVMGKGKEAYE